MILWHQNPRRGQLVTAVSPLALRDGIDIGMPLTEAKATAKLSRQAIKKNKETINSRRHPRQQSKTIAKKLNELPPVPTPPATSIPEKSPASSSNPLPPQSSSFNFFAADFEGDAATLQQLAVSCQTLAPITGIEACQYPDSLFLDVTNLAPLYGDETQLLAKVMKHFEQRSYTVRAAIADTVGAAWGLAHHTPAPASIAPVHSQLEALEQLPIQSLRLSEATCETLRQLGIADVQQLLQLPRTSLTSRFGDEINERLDQAAGTIREVFQAIHTPPEYSAEELLEWPIKDSETTLVIVERLIQKICQQLISNSCGGMQWHVQLTRQQATPIKLDIKLFQPTTTAAHVMQLVEMQLDNHPELRQLSTRKRKHFVKQSPIVAVDVSVAHCVQLTERQQQLFDEEPSLQRTALAQLINRLSSRLGQDQVTRPVLQANAQPEFSFRFKPLVTPSRHSRTRQKESHYVLARPVRLLNPVIPLLPCPSAKRPPSRNLPAAFQKPDYSRLQINRHWGPERIETGWWRGQTVCRDYWRIETDVGSQQWIYRDRRTGKWFLHGEF